MPPEKEKILAPSGLQPVGFLHYTWEAKIPPTTPFSALSNPTFWQHHHPDVRALDRIFAEAEDASWWAELLVTKVGVGYVHTKVLRHIQLIEEEKEIAADARHQIKWKGPNGLFSVIDTVTGNTIQEKLPTKDEAHKWIDAHLRGAA